jgi:hypothetical protein
MPDMTRRSVLRLGVGAAGLAAVEGPAAAIATGAFAADKPAVPARSLFASAVGTTFTAHGLGGRHRLTLHEIADVPAIDGNPDENRFNLLFTTADGSPLGEGIYRLTRSATPTTLLFMSPVGTRATKPGIRMQALVNRLG